MSETAYSGENKMGSMPINRLLVSMSLPMIASMLVQALYNIVDSIFVAQISENALTAVSLAFPVQSLLIAVSESMRFCRAPWASAARTRQIWRRPTAYSWPS